MDKYNISHLYRVWISKNEAVRCTYTRGVFNEFGTGRFISYEHKASAIRPVDVWIPACPQCSYECGWIDVDTVAEIGNCVACDACGNLIDMGGNK